MRLYYVDKIKHFYLKRTEDVSGTSGVGNVARGVILPSGAAILEWSTFHSSICIYKNIEDVTNIHGHGGKTVVIMGDPDDKTTSKRKTTRNTSKNSKAES